MKKVEMEAEALSQAAEEETLEGRHNLSKTLAAEDRQAVGMPTEQELLDAGRGDIISVSGGDLFKSICTVFPR